MRIHSPAITKVKPFIIIKAILNFLCLCQGEKVAEIA